MCAVNIYAGMVVEVDSASEDVRHMWRAAKKAKASMRRARRVLLSTLTADVRA